MHCGRRQHQDQADCSGDEGRQATGHAFNVQLTRARLKSVKLTHFVAGQCSVGVSDLSFVRCRPASVSRLADDVQLTTALRVGLAVAIRHP